MKNFRFGKAQRQIFKLPLHLPNTQTVGKRSVKRQSLGTVFFCTWSFGRCEIAQRLKTRSQAKQYHAEIGTQSKQQTAYGVGLLTDACLSLARAGLLAHVNNDFEICDEFADLFSEVFGQPFFRIFELVPNTKKIGCCQEVIVIANAAKDIHDALGMSHYGLACEKLLTLVKRLNDSTDISQIKSRSRFFHSFTTKQKKAVLIQKLPSTKGCVILPNLSDLSKFPLVNPLQLRLLKSVLSKTDREVQTRGRIGPGDWFCSPILPKPDSSRKSTPCSKGR